MVKDLAGYKELKAALLDVKGQLAQEAAMLDQCLMVSWSWEACGLTAIIVLLADRLIRPLWVGYTGKPYFLDT